MKVKTRFVFKHQNMGRVVGAQLDFGMLLFTLLVNNVILEVLVILVSCLFIVEHEYTCWSKSEIMEHFM